MSYRGGIIFDREDYLWVPAGVPGYYVSDHGHVMHGDKLLKPKKGDRAGHLAVAMYDKNGKAHYEYIHRLVLKGFYGGPHDKRKTNVLHRDDDKENNCLDNLYWGDQRDNHLDSVRNGTHVPFSEEARTKSIEVWRRPVIATDIETGEGLYFRSIADACRELGVNSRNIHHVLTGRRKHTRGYSFVYANKDKEGDYD